MQRITKPGSFSAQPLATALLGAGALLGILVGAFWLLWVSAPSIASDAEATHYPMNNPIFAYSPGWQVSQRGADPREPADPWREPAGVITFTVTGAEIDLLLALGDYWGYLYVTVDGQPANALPMLVGNGNSLGHVAGYKTFYAPERQSANGPEEVWVTVQRDPRSTVPHEVRVEVWRSWGQTPLRGVRIWAAPRAAWPRWPGVLLLVLGFWCVVGLASIVKLPHLRLQRVLVSSSRDGTIKGQQKNFLLSSRLLPLIVGEGQGGIVALLSTLTGMSLVALGLGDTQWWLVLPGLGLIGLAALLRPACWLAALLCGLPFYFRFPLPILPGRALGLIEIGVWGGLLLVILHRLLFWGLLSAGLVPRSRHSSRPDSGSGCPRWVRMGVVLAALVSWALVATFAAEQFAVALREWRTVFLAAGLFALLLPQANHHTSNSGTNRSADSPLPTGHWSLSTDPWLLLTGWLMGAVLVALVALWQYGAGYDLITAEGVWRVRAFYGSPNNLALYLERTVAVTLAFLLFASTLRSRLLWGGLALFQGSALVLTFSKGALLLGLPAMLATLALGSLALLRQQHRSLTLLWWILGLAALLGIALLPFLGTERFQRLLDFQQGTGFVRLQLWRSAWQMALDQPWVGVGPDNFLYQYRSNYLLPAAWQEPNLNHPHNWLLDWWTRLGLPGLLLALLFFGMIVNGLWQKIRRGHEPALALGLLAALVGALAHGLIDASYALPDLMLVWVLLAYFASEPVISKTVGQ